MVGSEMLRDQSAQRNPGDTHAGNAPPPKNIGELLGKVGNPIRRFRHRGFAVTRQVVPQQGEPIGERRHEIPEPVIDAEAMQQHQRPAGAHGMNGNVRPVQRAHAQPPIS